MTNWPADAVSPIEGKMDKLPRAGNAKLIICLDNNTHVLAQCRDELRLCRAEKRKL